MNDASHQPESAAVHIHNAEEGLSSTQPLLSSNATPRTIVEKREKSRARALEYARERAIRIASIVDDLDTVIWANLAAMYYMDNSIFRFLVRLIPQYTYLTQKPVAVPAPPVHHAAIFLLFSNIFCIFMHTFTSLPRSSELNRGYLHGSLIMDFVGQKGWSWKAGLVGHDLLIAGLMIFCFVVKIEGEKIKEIIKAPPGDVLPGQDYDAEERGVVRGFGENVHGDIEMQEIGLGGGADVAETDGLLMSDHHIEDGHVLDMFYTGNAVVADFHIMNTLRTVITQQNSQVDASNAGATALQGVGYTTAYNWTRLQQRLGRFR